MGLFLCGVGVDDNFQWAFAGIYDLTVDNSRRLLWEELVGFISWWDVPFWQRGSSLNSFLRLIYLLWGVPLRGPIIGCGPVWIGFWYLLCGNLISLRCTRSVYREFVQTISLAFWIVVVFMEVVDILSLKACGCWLMISKIW